ncbi:exosortase O [Pleurocapsales cyanobacterium LEGE 10410]|nr:exosortase O [Pleurocapsales cyanobacterium LEGE 10410]
MISKPIAKQQSSIQTIVLLSAWIIGNLWTYQWFIRSLRYTSRLNLIVLGLGLTALVIQSIRSSFFPGSLKLQFRLYPVLLMLGGEICAIILKWSINIPQLTLLCFILGSYGLLGMLIPEKTWRKGTTLAVIGACLIPFLVAFNSGLGFPMRVLTAHAVAQTLSEFHLSAASSHDIIVMENGIAQVDLPCSGMKSLWTGTVFLLGATWLERRQLGFRWLLVAIANLLFLTFANIARVMILVMVIEVWQQQQVADILHLPLGVVGFILASLATWVMLQKVPQHLQQLSFSTTENTEPKKSNLNWLLGIVIVLGVIGQFQPLQLNQSKITSINLPPEITTETLALSPAEANFFDNSANPLVQKLRFKSDLLSGSMLMVVSDTWQAHHPPELCFTGSGLKVDTMNSRLINDSINARWLSLQNGQLSAAYWFQSAETTTNDFVSRIWEHISHRDKTWVLVSILYDQAENPDSVAIKHFSNTIYQTIDRSFSS